MQMAGMLVNNTIYYFNISNTLVNEEYLAKYVKDVVDDQNASDETTFRRWVATMIGNVEPIDLGEIC